MKRFLMLLAPLAFFGASCERHDFEETRQLHGHGHHDDSHGEDHGEKKDHQ